MNTTDRTPRTIRLAIRATGEQRVIIDQAARARGVSRSAFMVDAATREAIDILLDQTNFILGKQAYAEVVGLLNAPPEPSAALRTLMATPAPWE